MFVPVLVPPMALYSACAVHPPCLAARSRLTEAAAASLLAVAGTDRNSQRPRGAAAGVWESETLVGVTGRSQVCAIMALYGPRTVSTSRPPPAAGCVRVFSASC
jgi:hypothetical protein